MAERIRFQTGELKEVSSEMLSGKIPCIDVDDNDELNWVINKLSDFDLIVNEEIPYDTEARDKLKDPEFEFRIAFIKKAKDSINSSKTEKLYLDIFFTSTFEETYDDIGEL